MKNKLVNKKKKHLKKSNWKRQGKKCLAFCGAAVLALQGTFTFAVPAGAATSDQATYDYPKSIKSNGNTWYDIYGGGKNTAYIFNEDQIILDTLLDPKRDSSKYGTDTLLYQWGNVAYEVLGSEPRMYYFDEDSSDKDADNKYKQEWEKYFNPERNSGVNSGDNFCDMKKVFALKGNGKDGYYLKRTNNTGNKKGYTECTDLGDKSYDIGWASGLQTASNLNVVKDELYNSIRNIWCDKVYDGVKAENPIAFFDKTESSSRVAYSIVASQFDWAGGGEFSGLQANHRYFVYALVFYDFQFGPLQEENSDGTVDGILVPSALNTLKTDAEPTDENITIDTVPGYNYYKTTNKDTAFLNNMSDSSVSQGYSLADNTNAGASYTTTTTDGTTEGTTKTDTTTQNIGSTGKLLKVLTMSQSQSESIAKSFQESYTLAENKQNSEGSSSTSTFSANYSVPAYSSKGAEATTVKEQCTVDYEQECAVSYKTAIVGFCGVAYWDGAATYRPHKDQYQYYTVFAPKKDTEGDENTVRADAIDHLYKRYNSVSSNSSTGVEAEYTTSLTKNGGGYWPDNGDWSTDTAKKKLTETTNTINWSKLKSRGLGDTIKNMDQKFHRMTPYKLTAEIVATNSTMTVNSAVPNRELDKLVPYYQKETNSSNGSTEVQVSAIDIEPNYKQVDLSRYSSVKGKFKGTKAAWDDMADTNVVEGGHWVLTDENGNEAVKNKDGSYENDYAVLYQNEDKKWCLDTKDVENGTEIVKLKYYIDGFNYRPLENDSEHANETQELDGSKSSVTSVKAARQDGKDITCASILIRISNKYNGVKIEQDAASMFSNATTGWAVVICVVVLVIAGGAFVVYKKRREGKAA